MVVESLWSNVNSSVADVLLLSTGLGRLKYVMNAWIIPSVNHLPTPTMVRTHPTCIYGSEHYHQYHKDSNKNCRRTVESNERRNK